MLYCNWHPYQSYKNLDLTICKTQFQVEKVKENFVKCEFNAFHVLYIFTKGWQDFSYIKIWTNPSESWKIMAYVQIIDWIFVLQSFAESFGILIQSLDRLFRYSIFYLSIDLPKCYYF